VDHVREPAARTPLHRRKRKKKTRKKTRWMDPIYTKPFRSIDYFVRASDLEQGRKASTQKTQLAGHLIGTFNLYLPRCVPPLLLRSAACSAAISTSSPSPVPTVQACKARPRHDLLHPRRPLLPGRCCRPFACLLHLSSTVGVGGRCKARPCCICVLALASAKVKV
jgi:hypothetical protein